MGLSMLLYVFGHKGIYFAISMAMSGFQPQHQVCFVEGPQIICLVILIVYEFFSAVSLLGSVISLFAFLVFFAIFGMCFNSLVKA
jgi:hypothetical protein